MDGQPARQLRSVLLTLLLAAPLAGVANIPTSKFTELPRSGLRGELHPILQRAVLHAPAARPAAATARLPAGGRRIVQRQDMRVER